MLLLKDLQRLPTGSKHLLWLNMVNNIGTGMVMPFLVIYVHQINGLPLTVATTAMTTMSVGVMLGAPLAGWLADRNGPESVVVLGMLTQAAGLTGYAVAEQGWHFIASAAVVGLGVGGSAAWNTLLAESAPKEQHPTVFSLNFTATNVSMGVGGLVGAAVSSNAHHLTFRALYVADALSCVLVGLFFVKSLKSWPSCKAELPLTREQKPSTSSYAVLLKYPKFLLLLLVGGLLFSASYGQLESGFPAHLTANLAVSASALAVLFTINTAGVVLGQLFLHRFFKSVRPDRLVSAAALLWAGSWALVQVAGSSASGEARYILLIAAITLFALGETCFAASMPTIVNALAPAHARGRFNAAYSTSISFGFIAGPLAAGAFIGSGAANGFITGLSVTCCLIALVFVSCGRLLTEPQPTEEALVDSRT